MVFLRFRSLFFAGVHERCNSNRLLASPDIAQAATVGSGTILSDRRGQDSAPRVADNFPILRPSFKLTINSRV
jgi:hypothetical protein